MYHCRMKQSANTVVKSWFIYHIIGIDWSCNKGNKVSIIEFYSDKFDRFKVKILVIKWDFVKYQKISVDLMRISSRFRFWRKYPRYSSLQILLIDKKWTYKIRFLMIDILALFQSTSMTTVIGQSYWKDFCTSP